MHHPIHSNISYLQTEDGLANTSGHDTVSPIRLFDLEGIGVDTDVVLRDFPYSFDTLRWDTYDVIKWQVDFLRMRLNHGWHDRLDTHLAKAFAGEAVIWELSDAIKRISPSDQAKLQRVLPHRRRSIAKFSAYHLDQRDSWLIQQEQQGDYKQDVGEGDFRNLIRTYDTACPALVRHPEFRKMLAGVANMVYDAETDQGRSVNHITITFHQMGIITMPNQLVTNSPEGIHQDGADYIVSAIVIERKGVTGGTSVVYGPDKKTEFCKVTLMPGQGLFQADAGSGLWHQVTAVEPAQDRDINLGERNIFGFDVKIHRH